MDTHPMTDTAVSLATQIVALCQEHQEAEIAAGEDCVAVETAERKYQRAEQIEAEQEAKEQAEDAAFWSDAVSVTKCVAAAASVAGGVFTGGSTVVLAAGILGGGLTIGSEVASRTGVDKAVCTGLAIAGAAASLVGGGASALAGVPTETGATASAAANFVGAGATAGQGGATIAEKHAESGEASATADSKDAASKAGVAGDSVDDAIAAMQQSMRDAKLANETAAAMLAAESDINTLLVTAVRG
jgi:hypothetical protein